MLKIERIYKIKDGANIGIKLLVIKFGLYKSNKLTKKTLVTDVIYSLLHFQPGQRMLETF